MCGCITRTFEFSDIRIRWNIEQYLPMYSTRYNIAPEQTTSNGQKVTVIVREANSNQCRLMHWGLIPSWAKDPTITSGLGFPGSNRDSDFPAKTKIG